MLSLNFGHSDLAVVDSAFYSQSMPDPVSPTYTAYSAPSPFSSGSSASFPNRSPVSESFDTMTDSDHHHSTTIDDYTYPPPSSNPMSAYADLTYVQAHDFDMGLVNWSNSDIAVADVKRHPPSSRPFQQFQHPTYRPGPSQELSGEVERMKNLALYIPPSPPYQQRHQSPTIIHSPIPISVPSNAPIQSSSVASHSPHPLQQSHRAQHQFQDQYLHAEPDKWRSSPTTSHRPQYPPTYNHSQAQSGGMAQGYGDPSHPSVMRRVVSDYSSRHSSGNVRIKQEDLEMYSSLGAYTGQQRQMFDLVSPSPKTAVPTHPHSLPSPSYYAHHPETLHHQQQQHQRLSFAIHPADLTPTDPSVGHTSFESSQPDIGYSADTRFEQAVFGSDAGFVDVCDPRFVNNIPEKVEPVDSGQESEQDDEWGAGVEAEYAREASGAAGEQEGGPVVGADDADGDADADADGEDDLELEYPPTGYSPPTPHHVHTQASSAPQRGGVSSSRGSLSRQVERTPTEDDYDDEDPESDEDDSRDPEFVLRRRTRRQTSSSYPTMEGRSLRSGRYNPYPSSYSTSPPTEGFTTAEYASSTQPQERFPAQPLRPRRGYAHTSVSPTASEPYSPVSVAGSDLATGGSSSASRRRARPSMAVPIPIPVPNLTKKSRGRRVPTMEDFQNEDDAPAPTAAAGKGKKKSAGALTKGMRTYTCDVDGCGKLFARGEHLKRHIRSIHTYEKREFLWALPVDVEFLTVFF
ncbi:hypothetical protein H0H92_010330 [Tricholoma furcatifolium]|nr:hypothetical protein H0H92_010330 [Tricholoma furcatifolium]